MPVNRPSWFPPRIDWFPGEDQEQINFTIREACGADWISLKALCRAAGVKPSARTMSRWMGMHGFTVRVAVRNYRHIAAVCVSRHSPAGSSIIACYVCPEYRDRRLEQRLLMLAALELPEASLTWVIDPAQDETRAARLVRMGWKFHDNETDEAGGEHHRYTHPAIVTRRNEETGAGDCA